MYDGEGMIMFVVLLKYKVDLSRIDEARELHLNWLKVQYENGFLIASGKQNPRVGGVIITRCMSRKKVEEIIQTDPFAQKDLANYEIIEFEPGMVCSELNQEKQYAIS